MGTKTQDTHSRPRSPNERVISFCWISGSLVFKNER